MTVLAGFQQQGLNDTYAAWDDGKKVVMWRCPTGGGKTVVVGRMCEEHDGYGLVTAHRSVLVTQLSQQLAREGIRHSIIGQDATVRQARNNHVREFGRNFIDPHAQFRVASVDTLVLMDPRETFFRDTTLFIGDESHHFLRMNKWGKAWHMFQNPNLRTFLPTATPIRAEGAGLGAHADGIADILIEGPEQRWLIDNGYLTDYKVWCPTPTDLDLSGVSISATTGDYNQQQLAKAMAKSTAIVGDVVSTYLKHAADKLGVTFAVDISEATRIAAGFNAAGVPAAVISSKTPEGERIRLLSDFAQRKLLQLVNVDLFGEGFDLPDIECVSMARPTASLALYMQQFGRALRLMISRVLRAAWDTYPPFQRKQMIAESPKPIAFIFDHVGNVLRHGLPDKPRIWTLDRRPKRGSNLKDAIPMIQCDQCENPYEIIESRCPHCGAPKPLPDESARSLPNLVGGDIFELDPEVLRKMRGEVAKIDSSWVAIPQGAGPTAAANQRKIHREAQSAQKRLRHYVAWWAGTHHGEPDDKVIRRFYHTFNIDMLSAFALRKADADTLAERVKEKVAEIINYDIDLPQY
jgi:superfamily II DNA or RNA helicase